MGNESLQAKLEEIIAFADKAHGSQMRKYTPERYIVHPVRVMELCKQYTQELPILAAAILHDVLEDTPVGKDEIKRFLLSVMTPAEAQQTIALVTELTDVYAKNAYPAWNRGKRKAKELERLEKTSADSQTIKYADIIDNCNEIVLHDPDFANVFLRECNTMLRKLNKGDQALYKLAIEKVEGKLKDLKRQT